MEGPRMLVVRAIAIGGPIVDELVVGSLGTREHFVTVVSFLRHFLKQILRRLKLVAYILLSLVHPYRVLGQSINLRIQITNLARLID
jgi:hypothetical protein